MNPSFAPDLPAEKAPVLAVSWKDGFWAGALTLLALGQLAMGTDPAYTGLVLAFSVLWLLAIRFSGGPKTLPGIVVGYIGFQHIIFSQFAKVLYWQRPDTPLYDPIKTMQVYCVGMAGILCAAVLTGQTPLKRIRPILTSDIPVDRLKIIAYAATLLMVLRYAGSPQLGGHGLRVLMNFEFIQPVAAAATTAWVIRETQGRKFMCWLSYINIIVPFLVAMVGFQRRDSTVALVVIVATAVFFGFRFKPKHYLSALGLVYFFQFVFFPFALYYRNLPGRTNDLARNVQRSWEALTTVLSNPLEFQKEEKYGPKDSEWYAKRMLYYDLRPNPTADRMSVIIVTDALIKAADEEAPAGWGTVNEGFQMLLPRVFNEEKQTLGTSNEIAQKAPGLVSDVNLTTQITMGYFGEAYMSFRWAGVFFFGFVAFSIGFWMIRYTIGAQLGGNLWALAFILAIPWVSSEGTIQALVIAYLQTLPLVSAFGFLFMFVGNTFSRGIDRQKETVGEEPVFEGRDLRLAG